MSTPPTETDLLRALQLDAGPRGVRLFRNNVGAYKLPSGQMLRYGVANPGGSDLLGWTSRVLTAADVGQRVAIFTAIEAKRHPRRPTVDQLRFLDAVDAAGGLTSVAYAVEDLARMLLPK